MTHQQGPVDIQLALTGALPPEVLPSLQRQVAAMETGKPSRTKQQQHPSPWVVEAAWTARFEEGMEALRRNLSSVLRNGQTNPS